VNRIGDDVWPMMVTGSGEIMNRYRILAQTPRPLHVLNQLFLNKRSRSPRKNGSPATPAATIPRRLCSRLFQRAQGSA
jgi:hypothetical protein